uniref:BHLH domain-containing protein n=1 Tax=Meloidogyne incognita TaxID=6306 RepID=A0A914KQ38_MELIC
MPKMTTPVKSPKEAKIPLPHELNELSTHGTTVWKRNERERIRVRQVNDGYTRLKNTLPLTENDRRLSKVDTLRLAIAYIHHLENLINEGVNHLIECQCFNYVMGECSSAENTPPPN